MNRFINTAINKMLQDFEINNYTLTEECETNVNIIQNDIPIFNEYLFVASTAYYLVAINLIAINDLDKVKVNALYTIDSVEKLRNFTLNNKMLLSKTKINAQNYYNKHKSNPR